MGPRMGIEIGIINGKNDWNIDVKWCKWVILPYDSEDVGLSHHQNHQLDVIVVIQLYNYNYIHSE